MKLDALWKEIVFLCLLYIANMIVLDSLRYFFFHERFVMPFMKDTFVSDFLFLMILSAVNGMVSIKFETKSVWFASFFGLLLFYFINFFIIIVQFIFDPNILLQLIPTLKYTYTEYKPDVDFWVIYNFYMFWYFGSFILYLVMYFIPLLAITIFVYFGTRIVLRGIV